MAIKKKDFIELEYTGKLKEDNVVFDTTDEKVAKEAHIFSENGDYNPVIICIGEGHILPGIDEFLEGKETGEHKVELSADKAFGKKDPKRVVMIPTNKFTEQNVKPVPGLRLNIDGAIGIVKTVTGGRCIVDFNHPLAGRDVVYELKVNKIVTDEKTKVEALLKVLLGIRHPQVEMKDKKAVIELPAELPKQILDELAKKIKDVTGVDTDFKVQEK